MGRSFKVFELAIGPVSIVDAQLQANEQTPRAERDSFYAFIGYLLPLQVVWQVSRKAHSTRT